MTRNSSAPRENGTWHAGRWCPIIWKAKPDGALVERTESKEEETTLKRDTEARRWGPIRMAPTSRSAYVTGRPNPRSCPNTRSANSRAISFAIMRVTSRSRCRSI